MSPITKKRPVKKRQAGVVCSNCKETRENATRLPRGWHEHVDRILCEKCWPETYVLRAVTIPVARPVDADWDELGDRLRECWRLATVVSNWTSTELAQLDVTRHPEMDKLPAYPKTVAAYDEELPILTYLYRAAREALPDVAPRSLTSLLQRAVRVYRADRFDVIWMGRRSLRNYRYPQPYPCHNQAWSARYGPEGEPLISVELGTGDRWTLQLRRGKPFGRQLGAFDQLVKGDAMKGELAILRRARDGEVHAKLVMWLPRRERQQRAKKGTLIVRTHADSFLVYHMADADQVRFLHADHVRRWVQEHEKRLLRLSDDTKAERRRPRKNSRGIQAKRDIWVWKYRARMDTWTHEVSAIIAGYAERQAVEHVLYDDSLRSYLPSAPYAILRERLAYKLAERDIAFEVTESEESDAIRARVEHTAEPSN